jgi:hypothetical protein
VLRKGVILAPTIYTSYWNNRRLIDWEGARISISHGAPRGKLPYDYKRLPILYPNPNLLVGYKEGSIFADEFVAVYRKYLETLQPERVLDMIEAKSGRRPAVLECWDCPGELCHRHLVADWLADHLGSEILELPRYRRFSWLAG